MKEHVALTLNAPNLNGRTYTTQVVEMALVDLNEKIEKNVMFVESDNLYNHEIDLDKVIGLIKSAKVEGDNLKVTVQPLRDNEIIFQALDEGVLHVRPKGIGNLSSDGVVEDFVFISFNLISDPA